MLDIKVEVELECECGAPLEGEWCNGVIKIAPCEKCLKDKSDEGYLEAQDKYDV